ncbi:response regulator [Hymenobacter guriensis]|uniref:Response regulator n=1 Tax=Hymenobacter guriensis TaxID=2793065 RepID=A0ABS0L572_9BACT|nr:response regulator [Hymenobacter guriensis]MBG8554668.1 response regulator [Hymenobacter guriensis]
MTPLPSVLLIDDDPINNFLNKSLLTRLGIAQHLTVVESGHAALDFLRQHCQQPTPVCPVLILLDINMPGMNGLQFLEAYQQLLPEQRQGVVIVILTTSLHPRDVRQVEQLGIIDEFLSKPLTADKVSALLHKYFP